DFKCNATIQPIINLVGVVRGEVSWHLGCQNYRHRIASLLGIAKQLSDAAEGNWLLHLGGVLEGSLHAGGETIVNIESDPHCVLPESVAKFYSLLPLFRVVV